MLPFVIVDAPSVLGLRPSGVEDLPEALKAAGLQAGLNAEYAGRVEPPPYDAKRDPQTLVLRPGTPPPPRWSTAAGDDRSPRGDVIAGLSP